MITKKPLARVTVTLPPDLVKAADALARAEGRSRSWVVAEALRRHTQNPPAKVRAVREAAAPSYEVQRQFEEADRARLEADLALTPEQRVHLAEDLARAVPKGRRRRPVRQIVQFDTYEDFLDWKRLQDLTP